ncbi:MAG: sodium:solute symporter [Flammeovirgaceae bacterium TMED32]|nr:MAG: sodium:solute symporter [Flammeovirgaceae bacterium TMED32]
MNQIDFLVLTLTLLSIVTFGVWKTRGQQNIASYLLGDHKMKWGTIGLSVMATQASAITFISTPGQAYASGMGFVQNYFGLPLALIIVSVFFIPIYYKLKVYTAYEYLERRFDLKTRLLGALLFLIQRGLAAGITIYAPSIILSTILGWDLSFTILGTGMLVIIYTVSGGTQAVSITQKQQMGVIMVGMFVAFGYILYYITDFISLRDAVDVAGILDKTDAIDFDFNFQKRYTIWSGLMAGLVLQLSYFGTDQSQVQRYLGGKNVKESRMGLMFNAILKIPMQLFILFIGVMVYVFYIFFTPPIHFNDQSLEVLRESSANDQLITIENSYNDLIFERKNLTLSYTEEENATKKLKFKDNLISIDAQQEVMRNEVKNLITEVDPKLATKDSDYVFLTFILNYLPHGFIGLLIAVILSASMSSTSSELNSLASTSTVDLYQRIIKREDTDKSYLVASKWITFIWGILAIIFAFVANDSENLIETVNIIGSVFYGTILGIFLVAFFIKRVQGNAVFTAAIVAESVVMSCHFLNVNGYFSIGYLWYNAIGVLLTVVFAWLFSFMQEKPRATNERQNSKKGRFEA